MNYRPFESMEDLLQVAQLMVAGLRSWQGYLQLSHEQKPLLLSRKPWLFDRDPYNGLLYSLDNRVGFHPLKIPYRTMGPFFIAQFAKKFPDLPVIDWQIACFSPKKN